MRIIGLCLLSALLFACAPNSVGDLRTKPGLVTQLQISENYQSVYRRLTSQGRACFDQNLITAQKMLKSELYSDLGVAEVSYVLSGVDIEVYAVVDIEKDGSGTKLKTTSAKGFEEMNKMVERHLSGKC